MLTTLSASHWQLCSSSSDIWEVRVLEVQIACSKSLFVKFFYHDLDVPWYYIHLVIVIKELIYE